MNGAVKKNYGHCLEMTEILLNIIYVVQSGSWHLLLECISKMLPYCFAYNHINYASYLTYFLGDMLQLNKSFPEIYPQVVGNFAAQLSSDKIFSRIETDKIIEMTMNKDTKIPGGTTGFLTNVGTGPRWELNASYRASLRRCIHDHLKYEQKYVKHKDLTKSRIGREEKDAKSVYNVLSVVFIPPFSEQPLVSISTGIVVTENEADKIMQAYVTGKTAMQSFIDNRLSSNTKASFFDPI